MVGRWNVLWGCPIFQFARSLFMFSDPFSDRHCDDPWYIAAWSGSLRQNHSLNFPSTSRVCFVHWNQLRPFPSSINNTWWVLNLGSYTIPPCIYIWYIYLHLTAWFLWYTCVGKCTIWKHGSYMGKNGSTSNWTTLRPSWTKEGFSSPIFVAQQRSECRSTFELQCNRIFSPQFDPQFHRFFSFLRMETNKRGGKHQKNSHPRMAPRKGPGGEI